jgi:hypothetical protein
VALGRAARDREALGDLRVRKPLRDEAQDLDLALGEACRARAPDRARVLAGGVEDRPHRVGVQVAAARLGGEDVAGLLARAGGPVGARLGHRLEGVRRGEDPAGQADHRRRRLAVVARAVEALVVQADDGGEAGERATAREDALGVVGVQPHALLVGPGERARPLADAVGDRRAPDVVE